MAAPQPAPGAVPALPQPAQGGVPLDPAAELKATLAARVKLEELWQKYQSDLTATQDKALAAVASATDFPSFSSQMDQVIQTDTAFQAAKDKKDAEAKWLNDHGIDLIKANHKVAEEVEKELGKSSQLQWFEQWEKAAKPKPAAAPAAKPRRSRPRAKAKTVA